MTLLTDRDMKVDLIDYNKAFSWLNFISLIFNKFMTFNIAITNSSRRTMPRIISGVCVILRVSASCYLLNGTVDQISLIKGIVSSPRPCLNLYLMSTITFCSLLVGLYEDLFKWFPTRF